jgi:hypothetical protein
MFSQAHRSVPHSAPPASIQRRALLSGSGIRAAVHPRRADHSDRCRRVDRSARNRAPDSRQAVRRQSHPVHDRVRQDPLVDEEGRHRIRHQGDPARRLHLHDRHVPAREGRRHPQLKHRFLPDPGAGRPLGERRDRRRRRRAPDLLRAPRVETRHHHARRARHEPAPRDRARRDRADGLRHPAVHADARVGESVCASGDEREDRVRGRGSARPGRRGRSQAR